MFFDNNFRYGGTAPALWLSFILLVINVGSVKAVRKKENV